MMDDRTISQRAFIATGVGLLLLLALTAALGRIDLGAWNTAAAMAIAVAKAGLVLFFFMEIKVSQRLIWVAAGIGFFWLAILAIAVWTDVITRMPVVPR